tara:strand:+ start:17 stop:928 length:912 start_codon:yes stop_codon:yes gene_type:complete
VNKLERLLDLVAALLSAERPLSRHEIRERMPVGAYAESDEAFRRTFERDKDELRSLGIPLSVETVPASSPPIEGYRIYREEYKGSVSELGADELAALHLASNLVCIEGVETESQLLGSSSFPTAAESPFLEVPTGSEIQKLTEAITERRVVSFGYNDEERFLEPYRVVFNKGFWYLLGYDRNRKEERQFRVDRIEKEVRFCDDFFDVIDGKVVLSDEPSWCYGDDDPSSVKLLVDEKHAPWVIEYLGNDSVLNQNSDGSVIVEKEVRDIKVFRSFVLGFLDGAEILSPPKIRHDFCTWLESLT